jgi:hypothetical protein
MADVLEVDALTGVTIERDFTPDELAQRELDRIAFEEAESARVAEEESRVSAKESALIKLTSLGLTEEEAKAIVGI